MCRFWKVSLYGMLRISQLFDKCMLSTLSLASHNIFSVSYKKIPPPPQDFWPGSCMHLESTQLK